MVDPYTAVCCQMNIENITKEEDKRKVVEHIGQMIEWAVEGMSQLFPLRLVVFPECVHGCAFPTAKEMLKLTIEIPGEETDLIGDYAEQYDLYVAPGSWYERSSKWSLFFNTFPLIGPNGKVILKYRKVNPWMPIEFVVSPHDLLATGNYDEELFPVAKTEIGNIGLYICYDGLFPEVTRQLAYNGAELLVRCSAYMDPWGTQPLDWWTLVNRMRSIENMAYGLCCQSGSSLRGCPPYSWPGHSMIVDYEGRILASAGTGERIIGATIDIEGLRRYRKTVRQHNMLAHLRTEAYDYLKERVFPQTPDLGQRGDFSASGSEELVRKAMRKFYRGYYRDQ